ncbi:hypothetical protein [Kitasatospora azatica]|uniref:hypothetical protein n=1 Tax=Kitasatospora azatica TaxID=58347 RepID=UPI00068C778E|nr:hypothetical protein [Kitasatospora azatica]
MPEQLDQPKVVDLPKDPKDLKEPKGSKDPKEPGAEKEPKKDLQEEHQESEKEAKDESKEEKEKEKESEQEKAAGRFRELGRDPLLDDPDENGATDLAAASRAHRSARASLGVGRDLHAFDRSVFHSAHIGDVHLSLDARQSAAALSSGPVPEPELRRVRRVYREPEGYVRLRQALRLHRVLVLGGAPGTGRTCTALALLDEMTTRQEDDSERVLRVDQSLDVPTLTETITAQQDRPHRGHLLELTAQSPKELQLDALAAALTKTQSYAVLVVSAASSLLSGRYGLLCPPAPTEQLLRARLEVLLAERPELADQAEALAQQAELREAVGLEELRPVEAELLADLLAERLLGRIGQPELLTGCRSLALQQAREWFAGADQEITEPSTAAGVLHPTATRIALAVLNGAAHSTVAEAAHLLTWELAVTRDPVSAPARPLFGDDPVSDLAFLRAELTDGEVETAGIATPARLVRYRGPALPAAVLTEVWDRHHPARAPITRWLRMLADDPRPQLWIRAALAAGELCTRDFAHGYEELVRPLATAGTLRRRLFAALLLDQAARHSSHRQVVHALVRDWAESGFERLRWTAACALGYGHAADSVTAALDTLGRIGAQQDSAQPAVATVNVVRLLSGTDDLAVLRRTADWIGDRRPAYQDLGLLCTVKAAATEVSEVWDDEAAPDLAELQDLPLPLALATARPDRAVPLANLFWSALNTPRSHEAAMEVLEAWLRAAAEPDSRPAVRDGLAALLPLLIGSERERQRLDWLLRRMMNDSADPLPKARARELWHLATAAGTRTDEQRARAARGGERHDRG